MKGSLIALAIPLFLLAMGVEWLVARARGRRVYRLADVVADMGCGVLQQVGGLLLGVFIARFYVFTYAQGRLMDWPAAHPATWGVAFVGVDLAYYLWHRMSHRVNFMWAVHAVHHQSEDYNLAVALRQAVLSSATSWPFYLPLALLGLPPVVVGTTAALNTLYQFWIHTELVGRLGWLESWLNTPSHHRVHHAINPRYLDRNYAGVFIVWDRWFGSFEPEHEPPVYGLTQPLRSFNPLWAQVAGWVALAREARAARHWRDALRVWIAPPSWHPPGVEGEGSPWNARAPSPKHDVAVAPGRARYVGLHFALTVGATFALLLWGRELSLPVRVGAALLLALSLATEAGLLEHRRWALPLEGVRLMVLGVLGVGLLWGHGGPLGQGLAASTTSAEVGRSTVRTMGPVASSGWKLDHTTE